MDFKPFLDNIINITKQTHLLNDDRLEWCDVSHGIHLVELHNMLFKLLLDVLNVATDGARHINTLPVFDFELGFLPKL